VLNPIAIDGPTITIRKFQNAPLSIDRLIKLGSITKDAADFLEKLVIAGYNIFISGGTSSGKTTFLNVLSNYIPKDQRVITIEDSAELALIGVDNLVRLEMRQANLEGTGEITIRDLIHSSLRMRPDRLVIGEIRGPEALDMLQAMNTGHDGCMATGHGNSASDMLERIATMALTAMNIPLPAIKSQIASAIDIIIHLGRTNSKGRRVLEISEIDCFNGQNIIINPLYTFDYNKGLISTGNKLIHKDKILQHNLSL
jgi:pilus assembly protein CpaF